MCHRDQYEDVFYLTSICATFFLLITESNIANYADDTTLYKCEMNLIQVDTKIENESLKVFKCF